MAARRVVRRAEGEKAQQQMAVVATVYPQPRLRTSQEVFEHLIGLSPGRAPETGASVPPREGPEYKRGWANLLKGKAGIRAEVVEERRRRDPMRQKTWVGLSEGERAWPQSGKRRLRGAPLMLDFQHVLAMLGTAAAALHEEGRSHALAWIQERAWRLNKSASIR